MFSTSTTRTEKLRRLAWFTPIAILICLADAWLLRRPPAAPVPPGMLAPEWPVLFDLLLTVPLLYLFVFRRDGRKRQPISP